MEKEPRKKPTLNEQKKALDEFLKAMTELGIDLTKELKPEDKNVI